MAGLCDSQHAVTTLQPSLVHIRSVRAMTGRFLVGFVAFAAGVKLIFVAICYFMLTLGHTRALGDLDHATGSQVAQCFLRCCFGRPHGVLQLCT